MTRIVAVPLVAIVLLFSLGATGIFAEVVLFDFSGRQASSPNAPAGLDVRGPGDGQFILDPGSPPRFTGDTRGSLAVTYDSLAPTSRCYATFSQTGLTEADDFVMGAILTIRPGTLQADPFGFHPIAFSLFNASTTGDDRTGDLSDFRADTYDSMEFAYFPNISPLFGGPFLSPAVFGESIGPDAFTNFTFGSIPFELLPGVTYLVEMEHAAAAHRLTTRLWVIRRDGRAVPLPAGRVEVDLSGLTGWLVDSIGIPTYHDGFNIFSMSGRSLLATVDYDLLFAARKTEGRLPQELQRVLRRLKRRAPSLSGPQD